MIMETSYLLGTVLTSCKNQEVIGETSVVEDLVDAGAYVITCFYLCLQRTRDNIYSTCYAPNDIIACIHAFCHVIEDTITWLLIPIRQKHVYQFLKMFFLLYRVVWFVYK